MTPELFTLRQARLWRCHSQVSLALAAHINRRTIAGIELAHHTPKPATKRKLAAALGTEPWNITWPSPDRAGP